MIEQNIAKMSLQGSGSTTAIMWYKSGLSEKYKFKSCNYNSKSHLNSAGKGSQQLETFGINRHIKRDSIDR